MPPKKISLLGGKVVCVGTVLEPPKGGGGTAAGYLITAIRAFAGLSGEGAARFAAIFHRSSSKKEDTSAARRSHPLSVC